MTNMWEQINDILASRTNEVLHFGDQLEEFEQNRSSTMAKHLRMMVDKQVQIALKLPQQIERTAEAESYELNSVIIGNRRAHAELLARMEKEVSRVESSRFKITTIKFTTYSHTQQTTHTGHHREGRG